MVEAEPVKIWRTFLAAIASNLISFVLGICLGWTSPVLPKLMSDDLSGSPLDHKIDADESAWISSIMALGALASPFVAGPLTNRIGRKWVLLSSSLFFILAFVLMIIGSEVWVLMLGRVTQGFGVGFVMTAQPMYLGEISTDNVRGALSSLMPILMICGLAYADSIGPFVSYQALQWYCIAVPVVFVAFFFYMPESPYYYVSKDRQSDAMKSLQFLRGQRAEVVQHEHVIIKAAVEEAMANKGNFMDIARSRGNRKALFICVGLIIFQQLSGINVVLFNTQLIFESTSTDLDPAIATIIMAALNLVATCLLPITVDRLGRKVILLTSAGLMSICLGALGFFFYMKLVVGDISNLTWLPVPALFVYGLAYASGFGSLPWVVLSEMFPANVKSIATSIVASTNWIVGFSVPKCYPYLDALGTYYAFWLFAIFCAVAFFFVLFVVMETKGLSLQAIQDRLNGKKVA